MRYPSIDFTRGLAVIGMMFFHLNYMLEYIFLRDIIPLPDIFWSILGPTVAITFIFLSGFSFYLSSSQKSITKVWRSTGKRALLLALCAGIISFVTYTFIPEQRISFGIIHFFALTSILIIFFRSIPQYAIIIGACLLIVGYPLNDIRIDTIFFIPFGMASLDYYTADWYPLLPWFGYMLIGQGSAYSLDRYGYLPMLARSSSFYLSGIRYIGRHALLFYMLHVPILYSVLWYYLE